MSIAQWTPFSSLPLLPFLKTMSLAPIISQYPALQDGVGTSTTFLGSAGTHGIILATKTNRVREAICPVQSLTSSHSL